MTNNNYPVDIPKTYTVSYFDEAEWNKDLTPQEVAQQQELTNLQNQLGEFEKSYGPCNYKNDYCKCDCNRDDYRCNCQYDERWCNLRLSCPICPSDKVVKSWGHSGHVYYGVQISNKARIRCNKTHCETYAIKAWSFICANHDGKKINSSGSFTLAVLTAINAQKAGREYGVDEKLMGDLLVHLERNPW